MKSNQIELAATAFALQANETTTVVYKKWKILDSKFIHTCGRLSDDRWLAGHLCMTEEECTSCGRKAPEQVLMIARLQELS